MKLKTYIAEFIKSYWKTLLFFAIVGFIGGYFVGVYSLNGYPEDMKAQLIEEIDKAGVGGIPADILLGVIMAVQSLGYGVILGAFGIFFAKRTGLWKDEISISKKPLLSSVIVSVFGGLMLILPDILWFANYSDAIKDSYASKPTADYIIATVTYGAVIEEVMLRLFAMSLIAFVLHKIFEKSKDVPSEWVFIVSNVISALLFALGHLPATFIMIGDSPLVIFRCILLNGVFGLLFGWLYRKYGLRYSMIAHGGCHIISKLIWVLFI